jgi:hypothetical protein
VRCVSTSDGWEPTPSGVYNRVDGRTGRGGSIAAVSGRWSWAVWDWENDPGPAHTGHTRSLDEAKREADRALSEPRPVR